MKQTMRQWTILAILGLALLLTQAPAYANIDVSVCEGTTPSEAIDPDCMKLMEAFPDPTVIPVNEDRATLSSFSFWHVNREGANVFDGPGGNVTGRIEQGFNFVNVVDSSVADWVQISTGGWMHRDDVTFKEASYFRGVRILNGLETRFAWALGNMYTSPEPGAPQKDETGRLLLRYDLVNIFAETVDEEGWLWYMVGPNQWVDQRTVAKVFKIDRPEDVEGRWVAVDLYEQTLVAYEDDVPVFATLISSGLPGTETNLGVYEIWARLDLDRMSGFAGAPEAYSLEGVPWVMYFDESISLHGTYWHDYFGYRTSRGCVNMTISDARFVYQWFLDGHDEDEAEPVDYVYVHTSGEYGAPPHSVG